MTCSEATKRASRNFRANNPEAIKNYNESYYARNKERLKENRSKRYREAVIEREARSNFENVICEVNRTPQKTKQNTKSTD